MTRYRQEASYVAVWAVAVGIMLLLGLAGCQSSEVNIYAFDKSVIDVGRDAIRANQERGGQSDLGVEAAVDAQGNTVDGIPAL